MLDIDIPTIGIEEEHFIVRQDDNNALHDLSPTEADELIRLVGSKLAPEYKACQIEIRTDPSTSGDTLYRDLTETRDAARATLQKIGLDLFTQSTHPFGSARHYPARAGERYRNIEARMGIAVRQLLACGLHVHVGTFDNQDLSVRRLKQMWPITPLLIASNASSRWFEGQDTEWASYRRVLLLGLDAQVPPMVANRREYDAYLSQQYALGAAESPRDIWVDIRPGSNGLKTVEYRAADISSNAADNVALSVLLQGLEWVARKYNLFNVVMSQNSWQLIDKSCRLAAKHGMSANVFNAYVGQVQTLQEFAEYMLRIAREGIMNCGNSDWLPKVHRLFRLPETSPVIHPSQLKLEEILSD